MMKKQLFIRGDLNDLQHGKIPLRNKMWIDALHAEYGDITDGQRIWLYEITKHNGKYDPTIFPGIILISDGEYEIQINEAEMEYLSDGLYTSFRLIQI
jgi:hypothetical protein